MLNYINNFKINFQGPRVTSAVGASSGLPVQVFPESPRADKPSPTTPTTTSKYAPLLGRVLDSPVSPSPTTNDVTDSNHNNVTPNKFAPALGRVLDSPVSPSASSNGNGSSVDSNPVYTVPNKFAPALGRVLDSSPAQPTTLPLPQRESPKFTPVPEKVLDLPVSKQSPIPPPATYSPVTFSPKAPQSATRYVADLPSIRMDELKIDSNLKPSEVNNGRWTEEIRSATPKTNATLDKYSYSAGKRTFYNVYNLRHINVISLFLQ